MADTLDRLKTALRDRYTIERELGSGGMATVYLAQDLRHERQVAVKVLRPELAATLGPARFLQEIKIAANLHHPHILPLYDSGEADGFLYYVMPYEEGQSLREKLAKEGELPIAEAVRILREVVDALAHAHEHGVVHRDIKPDNVMLSSRHALVTDFGVAKAVSEATGRQKLTTEGIALGTPAYMAPEQAAADPHIDHRADIYAVGALGYELLTGRPPFTGTSQQEVLAAHVTQTAEPVTKYRDTVSPVLAELVMRCLKKKPADRWQSAEELLPQLEALATPSGGMTPTGTMPMTATQTPRRTGLVRSAIALGAVVVAVVGWWLFTGRDGTVEDLPSGPIPIAVLVFDDRGVGEDTGYIGEGIAEDINTQLAKISGFEVKAHGSARQLSHAELSYSEIAERLGARFLMHGSLRRAGDSLRITVQLIDPETESTRWAEDYTRSYTASNMFAVTRDVADRAASDLQVALSAGEQERLAVVATENTEAYLLYVQGRFFWNQRGEGIQRGLEYFERAVALDSLYAPAHTGVADAYSLLGVYGARRPTDAMPLAKAAALRALALDNMLAEAHAAIGFVNLMYDWDMSSAGSHFRRAIELNPSYAPAHYRLSEYLTAMGLLDAAVAAARRGVELDPLSSHAAHSLANRLTVIGEYTEAIIHVRRAIDLAPTAFQNYLQLATTYTEASRYPEAFAVYDTVFALGGRLPVIVSSYGQLLAATGDSTGIVAIYDELVARRGEEYVGSSHLAFVCLFLGRTEEVWEWLEMAYQERDPWLAWLPAAEQDSRFAMIRDDPRLDGFLRRMGLR